MRVDTLLSEIKTAWEGTFTGDTVYDFPPQAVQAPAAAIVLEGVEPNQAFGGSTDVMVRIQRFFAPAATETQYATMGQLADHDQAAGFRAVIEGGTYTQGVSVKYAGLTDIGMTTIAGAEFFTYSIMVEAID